MCRYKGYPVTAFKRMNIQTKTILTISTVFIALITAFVIILKTVLMDGFLRLEQSEVETNTSRVQNLLMFEQDNLQRLVSDWGVWSDAYQYMYTQNQSFVRSNLESTTFIANDIDVLLYMRYDGSTVYGREYNPETEELKSINPELMRNFVKQSRFLQLKKEEDTLSGILNTSDKTYMFAISAVLNSDGSGTSPGVLMMAQAIDDDFSTMLESVLQLDIQLYYNQQLLDSEMQYYLQMAQENNGFYQQEINDEIVHGFGIKNNIYEKPAILFQIALQRGIFQQGLITNQTLLYATIFMAIIILVLIFVLIRKLVVNKIANIILGLKRVQSGLVYNGELQAAGPDEIGMLTSTINEILEDFKKTTLELGTAKEIAEKNSQVKTQFLSQLSHELRTPLNAIIGFAELSSEYEADISNKDNILQILSAGEHLLGLIEDLLDISKLELGKYDIRSECVKIMACIEESICLIESMSKESGITISNQCQDLDDVFVSADSKRLKQILLNLLSNAIKYNREGGRVWISCEQDTQKLRINVHDTGYGIHQSDMQKIFDPFERGEMKNQPISGTGIGLSISKNLIHAMGGELGVSSEIGKGSCFWLELKRI